MSEATTQDASDSAMSGMHDFDFLLGHWTIMNRRLKERLKACSEWEQFEAKYECEPIWARFIWTKIDPNKTRWAAGVLSRLWTDLGDQLGHGGSLREASFLRLATI